IGASGRRASTASTSTCVPCKPRRRSMPASTGSLRREADAAERALTITRAQFDAPRELVFELWTDPAHAKHWMGPRGFTATHFEQDPRPGGAWRACARTTADANFGRAASFAKS